MCDIVLRSKPMLITEIVKPTRAMFWKDRTVGDVVVFEYVLEDPGRNRYAYTTDVRVLCGDQEVVDTPTLLSKRLKNFKFQELVFRLEVQESNTQL